MPSPQTLLRTLQTRPDADQTLALLSQLSRSKLAGSDLQEYHELLLFYKAYPRSPLLRVFCEQELSRFAERVGKLPKRDFEALDQSSVAGSRVFYPYDEPMAKWLLGQLGDHVDIDWDAYEERDDDPFSDYLSLFLEHAEGDAADASDLSTRELVESARGGRSSLTWLLERFGKLLPDRNVRHLIYNSMQIALQMRLEPPGPSRTILDDGPPKKLFLWNPEAARAKFDLIREIRRPIRIPAPVTPKRGRELMNLVYGTLLIRLRELYPATHANLNEIYDIPLERGIRIIWFFNVSDKRLPLEAGWGCLILKNNVPIGYGAGGMVAEQSEISINLYDTFRGGEAAWLYAQYARICHQWCRAPWLLTRKWQLGGEGNEEGIQSGSYWFYDKLGFRSLDPGLRKLADRERKRIAAQKGYRSPISVLRRLAEADMVLSLNGRPADEFEELPLDKIGLVATQVISEQFGGRREGLETRVLNEMKRRFGVNYTGWTKDERAAFAQLSLFVLALPKGERWSAKERKELFALCRAKGSVREAEYAKRIPENAKFWKALRAIK